MCFEEKWLQNRLRADENELRSPSADDIQGHQRGGFCIVPVSVTNSANSSNVMHFLCCKEIPSDKNKDKEKLMFNKTRLFDVRMVGLDNIDTSLSNFGGISVP